MGESTADLYAGRKTFFIAPDPSLLPESYMEDYLNHGYESYIICDDRYCPLYKKVEIIISLFSDCILFFYVDAVIEGLDWPKYILHLQHDYGNRVRIGVLYSKRRSESERERLERYYLFDVGVQCGCVALEYHHSKNFALLDKVMHANQAAGRRKTVRAICDDTSDVTFFYKKIEYKGKLEDVSLNHFSCVLFDAEPGELPAYAKVKDILLVVNGMHFHSNGVLMMQRETEAGLLYIFVFMKADGTQGLESDSAHRLSQKIYQMVTTRTKDLLHTVFTQARQSYESDKKSEQKPEQNNT